MSVVIELPSPITLNTMFSTQVRGKRPVKVKSPRYQAWSEEAELMLAMQNVQPQGDGPFYISYYVGRIRSDTGRRIGSNTDIDNHIKCMGDALVAAGIIPDDSMKYVRGVSARWVEGAVGARVKIEFGITMETPSWW